MAAGPDRPSLRQRARYRLDNLLARGTVATLISLGIVAATAVLVSSLILSIFDVTFSGSQDGRWLEDLWQSMLRVLDPGTMAGDVGWGRRLLALVVTIFGLLVAGTLIGIIANGVEDRVDSMRRGRSTVIESGHLVVLGGTERMGMVIQQLALARRGQPAGTIVVLADRDPGELHDEVRERLRGIDGTRVVYRNGDPTRRADLRIVRPGDASGIVVLADGDSDVTALTTTLALTAELGEEHRIPIVVEVGDSRTAVQLALGCPGVEPIVPQEAMGRIAAFALRQRGLSRVVLELTNAAGSGIHVVDRPAVVGIRFAEVVGRYENAIPIGRLAADDSIELDPPADREVCPGDRLVVISAGDPPRERSSVDDSLVGVRRSSAPISVEVRDEHVAVVGWNELGTHLLEGWARSVSSESTVEVFHDPLGVDAGNITVPDIGVAARFTPLHELSDVFGRRTKTTVIVLANWHLDATEADARTVIDVRALQRLAGARPEPAPRFVVELRDPDNTELLDLGGTDDYVASTAFAGQFVAQMVGQPVRRRILLEMYTADGPSLRLVGAEQLAVTGRHRFSEVSAAAYAAGVIAIGWRTRSATGADLVLGPLASSVVTLAAGDEIVVVG